MNMMKPNPIACRYDLWWPHSKTLVPFVWGATSLSLACGHSDSVVVVGTEGGRIFRCSCNPSSSVKGPSMLIHAGRCLKPAEPDGLGAMPCPIKFADYQSHIGFVNGLQCSPFQVQEPDVHQHLQHEKRKVLQSKQRPKCVDCCRHHNFKIKRITRLVNAHHYYVSEKGFSR